jgi:predicted transcriptional regulator
MANRKKLNPMKRITVTVSPEDYEAIDRLARCNDVSASWLIRRSMREYLERHGPSASLEIRLVTEVA